MFSLLIQKKTTFKFKMMNQLYFFKKLLTNLNQLKIKTINQLKLLTLDSRTYRKHHTEKGRQPWKLWSISRNNTPVLQHQVAFHFPSLKR